MNKSVFAKNIVLITVLVLLIVVCVGCKKKSKAVRLFWDANTEPDLAGYRIYRRHRFMFKHLDDPWTDWILIAEIQCATEPTYTDSTVRIGYEYEYTVTAFDSMNNEGGFSNFTRARIDY